MSRWQPFFIYIHSKRFNNDIAETKNRIMNDLPLKDKIEIAAEQIEQSDEVGCLTSKQLRHILTNFADSLITETKKTKEMDTHELAKLLLSTKNKKIIGSIDISTGDDDSDRRIFTDEFFGVNDINDDNEVVMLFAAEPKDNYGELI